jgi:hypothetical protein
MTEEQKATPTEDSVKEAMKAYEEAFMGWATTVAGATEPAAFLSLLMTYQIRVDDLTEACMKHVGLAMKKPEGSA